MASLDLQKVLEGKWEDGTRPKDLFERHVSKDPARYVADIVGGLSSAERRVQNGCAELSSLVSGADPALLAPHVDLFIANLDAKEAVLRWEAACTLGNGVVRGLPGARRQGRRVRREVQRQRDRPRRDKGKEGAEEARQGRSQGRRSRQSRRQMTMAV